MERNNAEQKIPRTLANKIPEYAEGKHKTGLRGKNQKHIKNLLAETKTVAAVGFHIPPSGNFRKKEKKTQSEIWPRKYLQGFLRSPPEPKPTSAPDLKAKCKCRLLNINTDQASEA